MKIRWIIAGVTLLLLGAFAAVANASQPQTKKKRAPPALVSVDLAAIGGDVLSPHGPYRVRPARIAFNYGGYYGAGTKGLWITHLKWVDWGQPVAFASGIVHARVWPSHRFITTAGAITLDQLRYCGTKPRLYYAYASMQVPAGFPQNARSVAYGEAEEALTPC
jgi:hypothetical protein